MRRVNGSRKIWGSSLTFFGATLKVFLSYKHQQVKITTNKTSENKNVVALCFANGKYFGSGLGVAPNASPFSGSLDLVTVGELNILHFLRYVPKIRRCKILNNKEITYQEIKNCQVESLAKK